MRYALDGTGPKARMKGLQPAWNKRKRPVRPEGVECLGEVLIPYRREHRTGSGQSSTSPITETSREVPLLSPWPRDLINLLKENGSLTRTTRPGRFPWVAASFITPAIFVALFLSQRYPFFSDNASPNTVFSLDWLYFEVSTVVLLVVALLVGYLFRRRFKYPLRGIFLTCSASSFFIILAIFLVMSAPVIDDLSVPNLAGFLVYVFVFSAFAGAIVAALIVAGAVIRQRFARASGDSAVIRR